MDYKNHLRFKLNFKSDSPIVNYAFFKTNMHYSYRKISATIFFYPNIFYLFTFDQLFF